MSCVIGSVWTIVIGSGVLFFSPFESAHELNATATTTDVTVPVMIRHLAFLILSFFLILRFDIFPAF